VLVLALSYGIVMAWRQATRKAREEVQSIVRDMEATIAKPRFEVGEVTETFNLGGDTRLSVDNRFGGVQVVAGGPAVEVEGRVSSCGLDVEAARETASALRIVGTPDPEAGFTVSVEGEPGTGDTEMDLVVQAPPEVEVRVRVFGGNVGVVERDAAVTVEARSGDIVLSNIGGSVRANNTSGNIEVRGAREGADVHASSGNIVVEDVDGTMIGRTMSGNVTVRDVRGEQITTTTSSGNVEVELVAPFSGQMEARTQSGNIRIAFSEGSSCRITTTTGSGQITSSLPLTGVVRAGINISGRLGAGRGAATMSTGSGNIELVMGE
jgi:hypothetical protein